jgi:hypothetical protein
MITNRTVETNPNILTKVKPENTTSTHSKERRSVVECVLKPPDILAIHASAVQANGSALLFLGPSGTGKSTMCHFLNAYTQILALDAVFLIRRAGTWEVANGDSRAFKRPLSLEEIATFSRIPLRAIFRLYQAPSPLLQQISSLATCRYLIDAFFEIGRQREYTYQTKQIAFSSLAAIARSVPGYQFYSDLSPFALRTLNNVVGLW